MHHRFRAAAAVALVALAGGCARPVADVPIAAGATASTASTAACDGPSPTPTSTFTAPPTTEPSFWAEQSRLDQVADKVSRFGARFPKSYAGLALETDHGRLAVYRVPSAAFDAALRAELPGAPLRLVDAAHSKRELDALLDRVEGDSAYWKGKGVIINMTSALGDGSCVEVGVHDPDRARPLFRQRYGPAPIRIEHAEPGVAR